MKSFEISLSNPESGFTLVELMVVVAIIGLLSSVAIPNFKRYQAKAKIAEAKLQLAAIYTAQQGFYTSFNMYAPCLKYMGFDASKEKSNRYYAVGFFADSNNRDINAHTSAINSGLLSSECAVGQQIFDGDAADNRGTYFLAGKSIGSTLPDLTFIQATNAGTEGNCVDGDNLSGGNCVGISSTAARTNFQAVAVGVISATHVLETNASQLKINHKKVFTTMSNGF